LEARFKEVEKGHLCPSSEQSIPLRSFIIPEAGSKIADATSKLQGEYIRAREGPVRYRKSGLKTSREACVQDTTIGVSLYQK